MGHKKTPIINSYNLQPGRILAGKYSIVEQVGSGWEGEVYLIRELKTGIERAAKVFYPHRNENDRVLTNYARRLHKLRFCPVLIHYHNHETFVIKKTKVTCLISDYVEGELLSNYINRHSGKRLPIYEALHVLYALTSGIEGIHNHGDYHGDLHSDNIIINKYGMGFQVKTVDLFNHKGSLAENQLFDVSNLIRIFYDAIGGQKHYAKHPQVIKALCCGLKSTLIQQKFRTAGKLRFYLDNMEWD